jgi:MoaA/NifB/PqqE/SkfB family radical SAM enzyme
VMCDHYKLYKVQEELKYGDLTATLDCIKDLGTPSVMISGGEPLANPNLFRLLQYGKSIGLQFGLLTNGVKLGGEPLTETEATIIRDTCSWVQLSIDSFNAKTYEAIRNANCLETARQSLHRIVQAGMKNVEVCFTIQKRNVCELPDFPSAAGNVVPTSVPIRFKFAHGNGPFLCTETELQEALRDASRENFRSNLPYLMDMIDKKHFEYSDIAQGSPLKSRMSEFHALQYTCKVLRLTCKINANGDVYPCCFLFDDNRTLSGFRDEFRLGNLKSPSGAVMPPKGGENPLKTIWQGEKIQSLAKRNLPVHPDACNYCTRHFYQNEFLNVLEKRFEEYRNAGLAEKWAGQNKQDSAEAFWV